MVYNNIVQQYFRQQEIGICGFADLSSLPEIQRENFPFGIVFGIPYSREGMLRNKEGDPRVSYEEYYAFNARMAEVGEGLAALLARDGFKAIAKKQSAIMVNSDHRTVLPYKTVATRAGLGWIGKCALLVTEEHGSALRLSTVLTNAPFVCGEPVDSSRCPESCTICAEVCPGHAPSGKRWEIGVDRAEFFDAHACNAGSRARAQDLLGVDESICALCMSNCPFTRCALGY